MNIKKHFEWEEKRERNKRIRLLYNNGLSLNEIAKIYKITRGRVWHIINSNIHNKFYRNVDLKKLRRKVILANDYKCQWGEKCKNEFDILPIKERMKKMNIHHIDFNEQNNRINNLIVLCKNCHSYFHRLTKIEELKNKSK